MVTGEITTFKNLSKRCFRGLYSVATKRYCKDAQAEHAIRKTYFLN